MQKQKKRNLHSSQKPINWFECLNDCLPAAVIPVGPRFQALVPEWSEPSHESYINDASMMLGTQIWPVQNDNLTQDDRKVGSGRPNSCKCSHPGSSHCISRHISEERNRLQSDLGYGYKIWKFDEMGEDVAKSWKRKERKKLNDLVRRNPASLGKSFLKSAETCFPSKTRNDIVSYYLNVYVPKRIRMRISSGSQVVDSDGDDEYQEMCCRKNSFKRCRVVASTPLVKSRYLTRTR